LDTWGVYSNIVTAQIAYQSDRGVKNASALSEARFHESVELGEVLCARSIEPLKVAASDCGGCGPKEL